MGPRVTSTSSGLNEIGKQLKQSLLSSQRYQNLNCCVSRFLTSCLNVERHSKMDTQPPYAKNVILLISLSFLLSNNFFALERSSCIILLCGIPASGKTQYASVLLKCINRLEEASEPFFTAFGKVPSFSACILEFDDYLHQSLSKNQGSFSPELWHESRRLAHQNLEDKLMQASSSSTALQKDFHVIIVEDTMQYRTMRMKIFQLATKCVYLFFPAKPCVHHF